MNGYSTLDCIKLIASLESLGQIQPTPANDALTRSIAIKRLRSIVDEQSKATVLKSSDLKSMESLLAFLKAHPEAYSGAAIVSDAERSGDIYWAPYFINGTALSAYLNHLHETIKDPINRPLLDELVAQVNQKLQLGYEKPKGTGQPDHAPGNASDKDRQNGKAAPGPATSSSTNAPLPLNNNNIDLTRIKDWLVANNSVVSPAYQQTIQNALSDLQWIATASNAHWAPISFSQPVDVVYTHVRDYHRNMGGQTAQHAVDMPLIYLQRLAQLIGDVSAVLDAYASQFPMKEAAIAQQRQFAQYIQVELSSWMAQIPSVQEKLDGKR